MLSNWAASLTRLAGIKAKTGYKRRPGEYDGRPSVLVDNKLDRQFHVEASDSLWVTDIIYIRTRKSFAYLAVITDLIPAGLGN
jgi:putative transposase